MNGYRALGLPFLFELCADSATYGRAGVNPSFFPKGSAGKGLRDVARGVQFLISFPDFPGGVCNCAQSNQRAQLSRAVDPAPLTVGTSL
jgi:hypothetical protein